MNTWFLSSDGSGNLSLTIKSMLLGIVPVIVTIGKMNGYSFVENDLVQLIDNGFALFAMIGVIIGLSRKVWFAYQNRV